MSKRSIQTKNLNEKAKKIKHWSLGLLESMKDPKNIIEQTENVVVIRDKYPKAKFHYLVLPVSDIKSIYKLDKSHISMLEEFGEIFRKLSKENPQLRCGFHAVPSMQRLHMHIISNDMVSSCLKTKVHWNSFTTNFFIPHGDIVKELKETGSIKRISDELHKQLMLTPLKCNQCEYQPKNMPQLKEHLLSHVKYNNHI